QRDRRVHGRLTRAINARLDIGDRRRVASRLRQRGRNLRSRQNRRQPDAALPNLRRFHSLQHLPPPLPRFALHLYVGRANSKSTASLTKNLENSTEQLLHSI